MFQDLIFVGIEKNLTFALPVRLQVTMLAGKGRMHDLLQKAAGWMLREAGKRDEARLVGYLRQRWNGIPATMRRYACEKLSLEMVESLRQESITILKQSRYKSDLENLIQISRTR